MKPTEKVQAGGYAGAVAVIVLWILGSVGVEVPPEAAAAGTLLISGLGAWVKTEGAGWFKKGDHSA